MNAGGGNGRKKLPPWLIPAAGYAVSIACLIWVYHGFDWRREIPRLRHTDWRWVTVAVMGDLAVYFTQGVRWSVLLKPVGELPVLRGVQAIYIGLFANEVLPLRPGELIRCFLVSRWASLPISVAVSSAVVERFLDGVWLVIGFYAAAQFVRLPVALVIGSQILIIVLACVAALLVVAILEKKKAEHIVSRSRWAEGLKHLVQGIYGMGTSPAFLVAAVVSLAYLGLQVVPIYALMQGFGIHLSVGAAAVVLVILRLGSIPPQAPGNVGAFQALTVLALHLFGVEKSLATGFATLLFFVVTVPLWLGGFIALLATRMRLDQIHREAHGVAGPVETSSVK